MLICKKRSTVFGGVLFAALAVATAAIGNDVNYYSGAFCTFSAEDAYDGQKRDSPKFANVSGSTRNAVCPLMSDAQTDIEQATIWATAAVDEDTCVFRRRGKDGASLGFWTHDSVTDVGSGINRTDFFTGGTFADTASGDTYSITCDLPHGQAITSYNLNEK